MASKAVALRPQLALMDLHEVIKRKWRIWIRNLKVY